MSLHPQNSCSGGISRPTSYALRASFLTAIRRPLSLAEGIAASLNSIESSLRFAKAAFSSSLAFSSVTCSAKQTMPEMMKTCLIVAPFRACSPSIYQAPKSLEEAAQ